MMSPVFSSILEGTVDIMANFGNLTEAKYMTGNL